MLKSLKENFAPILFATIVIGLFTFPFWSHFTQESKIKTQDQRIDEIRVNGGGDMLVGASTLFAQQASIQLNLEVLGTYASVSGNFSFSGEIMPDGSTCSNGQVLKRTGANDWDCASDNSSPASNSIDWDEIVPNMVLDTNTTITNGAFALTLTRASLSYSEFTIWSSASAYLGSAFDTVGDCNDSTEAIAWTTTGIFSCRSVQDLDATLTAWAAFNTNGILTQTAADTFTGRTLTGTTNQITITNGDGVSGNPTFTLPSLVVFPGAASVSTGFEVGGYASISNSGYFKWPFRSSFTFTQEGQSIVDTTANQIQIASAAFNNPVVFPSIQRIWSATIASTSNDFANGGRIPLATQDIGFRIKKIYCGIEAGTSVVINIDTNTGGKNTETVTCVPGGASDTDVATNNDFRSYTTPSGSLEFGALTGTLNDIDWLTFSVWGVWEPQ